jgi:hypothetical protein
MPAPRIKTSTLPGATAHAGTAAAAIDAPAALNAIRLEI